jgi:ABC-type microcin C transport system duplicated ATPase subunit YejF
MSDKNLTITIEGGMKTGKTAAATAITKVLCDLGAVVVSDDVDGEHVRRLDDTDVEIKVVQTPRDEMTPRKKAAKLLREAAKLLEQDEG